MLGSRASGFDYTLVAPQGKNDPKGIKDLYGLIIKNHVFKKDLKGL